MSLEMFTTHELEEAIVSSCNKNEQLRLQAWFRCKNFGYFTKPMKNITNGIFICHRQVNNYIKSNSYILKRQ
jgi:hypothetical protein